MLVDKLLRKQIISRKATSSGRQPKHQNKAHYNGGHKADDRIVSDGKISFCSSPTTRQKSSFITKATPDLSALCFSFYPGARPLPVGYCEASVK